MLQVPSKETTENEAIVAKGTQFWLAMVCIMLSTFLAAFDTVSQTTFGDTSLRLFPHPHM